MSGPPIHRGAQNMCCPGMGWVGIFWGRGLCSDLDQPSEPVGVRQVLRFVGALGGGLPAAPAMAGFALGHSFALAWSAKRRVTWQHLLWHVLGRSMEGVIQSREVSAAHLWCK
jgi:hypothetical protein